MEIVAVNDIPKAADIHSTPVGDLVDLYNTFRKMEQVCQSNIGIGLSAVQVGIPWKSFVIRFGDGDDSHFRHFVDCEYEGVGEKITSQEGCLSLRDATGKQLRTFIVERYPTVRVTGKELISEDKLELQEFEEEWDGLYSIVFQHEIDHHHGILISDIGKAINLW